MGLKKLMSVLLLCVTMVIALVSCGESVPILDRPEPKSFAHLDMPIVMARGIREGAAKNKYEMKGGIIPLGQGEADAVNGDAYICIIDSHTGELFNRYMVPRDVSYYMSTFGLYDEVTGLYWHLLDKDNLLLGFDKNTGIIAQTISLAGYPAVLAPIITPQGYVVIQDNVREEGGYRIRIINIHEDVVIRDDIYLPNMLFRCELDSTGERLYATLSGGDFDWKYGLWEIELASGTTTRVAVSQQGYLFSLRGIYNGEVLVAENMGWTDTTEMRSQLCIYNPSTGAVIRYPFPDPGYGRYLKGTIEYGDKIFALYGDNYDETGKTETWVYEVDIDAGVFSRIDSECFFDVPMEQSAIVCGDRLVLASTLEDFATIDVAIIDMRTWTKIVDKELVIY